MLGYHVGYRVYHAQPPDGFFQANGKLKAHILCVSVSAALLQVKRIKKGVSVCETLNPEHPPPSLDHSLCLHTDIMRLPAISVLSGASDEDVAWSRMG